MYDFERNETNERIERKKTGQARSNITSWSNPRTAREAEKMKEERRSNILYATIGVVFLLVAISVFVWKSM